MDEFRYVDSNRDHKVSKAEFDLILNHFKIQLSQQVRSRGLLALPRWYILTIMCCRRRIMSSSASTRLDPDFSVITTLSESSSAREAGRPQCKESRCLVTKYNRFCVPLPAASDQSLLLATVDPCRP